MPRITLIVTLALFVGGEVGAQTNIDETRTVIVELDNDKLILENDGTENGKRLYALGRELRALDEDIRQLKEQADMMPVTPSPPPESNNKNAPKPPTVKNENIEILHSVLAVMEQNRADAAEELREAWKLSNSRSWGSPAEHLESAQDNIQSARGALDKSMPSSLYCRTKIQSTREPSNIHYMPEGDFRSGGEDWVSYTVGAKIKIGNYRFRVSGDDAVFDQKVTILQDPFVHVIQPL
ncbi:hypothetical protein [Microbulbifer hydrolyticus]|uniref:Secreted protein n=1 Tax=Microbulbifer hydrolyticus TaxID=48074 RepID=A0A6P1TCA9_9GAMM|nr:hypothetical protein [Microbulbifer hydrolyticus]MBB5210117.1 hypothetical protein [Microbulbifer hydrolyticus]QHQ39365.1 hypothetical protein GTQ55_10440 [Microbulbifer hydrolyticus]